MHASARSAMAAALVMCLAPHASAADQRIDVVAFGTSLTANGGWQDELADGLETCSGSAVELHIVAQAGANSNWALEQLDEVVARAPDIVLVEFSMNDASLLHGVPVDRSRANTEAIVTQLQAALPQVRVVLMTMNPASGLRGLTRPFLDDFYRIYREIAAEHQVPLADLTLRWKADERWRDALADGVHPTPEAERAVIVPGLLALLGGPECGEEPL